MRLPASRLLLATVLLVSASLLAGTGGWWALTLGAVQVGLAAAMTVRLRSPWPPAWTVVAALPAPLAAARHWTAGLPGACHCARLPHPPPGVVSLTGLTVLIDVGILVMAMVVAAASRTAEVGKSTL